MTTQNATTTATPFLAKLDAITLDVIWQQTFPATTSAYGLACGVTDDDLVYMAGLVKDGGTFDHHHSTTSLGQDDVFVVQVSSAEGDTVWFQQLGTLGNDRLAHGSTGLVVLPN
jgi:acyl-CoA thioesterase